MGIVATIPESAVDYLLYGDKSHIVSDYLQNQLANIPQVFNQFTQRLHDAVSSSYRYVTDTMTRSGIMAELRGQGITTSQDYIQELRTFEELQNASPVMQRWVMAHPELKELYLKENVDGYSNSYTNTFGKGLREDDYNWRLVIDGVLQDNGEESYRTFYNKDDLIDGDRPLDHFEKVAILSTYESINILLKTNPYDFSLNSEALMKINWD